MRNISEKVKACKVNYAVGLVLDIFWRLTLLLSVMLYCSSFKKQRTILIEFQLSVMKSEVGAA
jgi:hypothetical protein